MIIVAVVVDRKGIVCQWLGIAENVDCDGIIGALGRLGSGAYGIVIKRSDRASLDTPRLSQATHVMNRPPSSDK